MAEFDLITELRREVQFTAVASRGPGGQNVNKVASAAMLTWGYLGSNLLTADQKMRVGVALSNMINSSGEIYLRSDEFRDLERNKTRCLEKLIDHVERAVHVPKTRRATKPTYSSKVKKLDSKKRRGNVKSMRKRVDY